jgi:hypothetical protein
MRYPSHINNSSRWSNCIPSTAACSTLLFSKSKSCYDWRPVSQYVVMSSLVCNLWPDIIFCLKAAVLSLWGALSDDRSGLSPVCHFQECLVHCQRFNISYIVHVTCGLENREYGRRDPSRWSRGILCLQKLALTSPTSGGRSVGIVRSRTQAMEFFVHVTCQSAQAQYSRFCSCPKL